MPTGRSTWAGQAQRLAERAGLGGRGFLEVLMPAFLWGSSKGIPGKASGLQAVRKRRAKESFANWQQVF